MRITSLKPGIPFDRLVHLCMLIREGRLQATPEVRSRAKAVTFAFAYGGRG